MDKKAKKRIKALRGKIEKLKQVLAGAKAQTDEPGEIAAVEKEIADCLAQIEAYKKS